MTTKMAKEAAAKTSVSPTPTNASATCAGPATTANKTGVPEGEVKRKGSMFYPPYTGYDQPTRDDEGQLSMPQLWPRRSQSDSTNPASALLTAIDLTNTAAAATTTATADEETDVPEDFYSIQSFSTDASVVFSQPRSILKSPQPELEARFRQFLVDADEMQISHRKGARTLLI